MEQFFKEGRKSPYYKLIKKSLQRMDKEILLLLESEESLLSKTATHLFKSGGKRLRPIFVLLGGHFGVYDEEKLFPLAMAMEITHMATLVHDDVVDSATLRRGKATVKARWGNEVSVFTGNYLLSKAMGLIASYHDERINRPLANVALEMCRGELSQMSDAYGLATDIDTYLLRIEEKTALLLSISCELGAYISGASQEVVYHLKDFGKNLGIAFQITDDILDYLPDSGKFGKILGGDIRQGIPTLPLLYALDHSDDAAYIKETFPKRNKTEEEVLRILKAVTDCGGIEHAQAVCLEYTKKAKENLQALPDCEAKIDFLNIADYILNRKY